MIRVRISNQEAHYGGGLVSGAKILGYFGDAATEILIRHDGDEGLFVAYDEVLFLAPVYAGDFLEVTAKLEKIGNRSRTISFQAVKVIEASRDISNPTKAHVLSSPLVVTKASGTCVIPK
ncbi:hotdog fold domain-containing protein [Shimazuella kribbensis]|uniref:3-aminobutyryl-CoA ammonia lyase n=1 Tax=Shimazuella kribbensis TaxID=139808 RepID=UPI0003FBE750|nr:hotdog fold domain-containing protein [Shimazuella kribbensis]